MLGPARGRVQDGWIEPIDLACPPLLMLVFIFLSSFKFKSLYPIDNQVS